MNETHYAKGITAQNLRAFLELWPLVAIGIEDTKEMVWTPPSPPGSRDKQ